MKLNIKKGSVLGSYKVKNDNEAKALIRMIEGFIKKSICNPKEIKIIEGKFDFDKMKEPVDAIISEDVGQHKGYYDAYKIADNSTMLYILNRTNLRRVEKIKERARNTAVAPDKRLLTGDKRMRDAEANVASLTVRVNELTAENEELSKGDVAGIKKERDDLKTEVKDLKKSLKEKDAEIEGLTKDLEAASKEVVEEVENKSEPNTPPTNDDE